MSSTNALLGLSDVSGKDSKCNPLEIYGCNNKSTFICTVYHALLDRESSCSGVQAELYSIILPGLKVPCAYSRDSALSIKGQVAALWLLNITSKALWDKKVLGNYFHIVSLFFLKQCNFKINRCKSIFFPFWLHKQQAYIMETKQHGKQIRQPRHKKAILKNSEPRATEDRILCWGRRKKRHVGFFFLLWPEFGQQCLNPQQVPEEEGLKSTRK